MAVKVFSQRVCLAGSIICIGSLAFAYWYLEQYLGLTPCPLCIFDRVVIAALAACFIIALLHKPACTGQRIYAAVIIALSLTGTAFAGRHIHLQNLPPGAIPDCLPDLSYMLTQFRLLKTIQTVFNSAGECAEISWTFLGLTIPQQTLLLFIVMAIMGAALWLDAPRQSYDTPGNCQRG